MIPRRTLLALLLVTLAPAMASATMVLVSGPRLAVQAAAPSAAIPDADDERAAYDLWGWA